MSKILTAAEVEAMREKWRVSEHSTHYERCDEDHFSCAIARLAASHLALLREREGKSE